VHCDVVMGNSVGSSFNRIYGTMSLVDQTSRHELQHLLSKGAYQCSRLLERIRKKRLEFPGAANDYSEWDAADQCGDCGESRSRWYVFIHLRNTSCISKKNPPTTGMLI